MPTTQTSFAGGVAVLSSTLDNATATQLGLKQYLADKAGGANDIAYNGSNKATLTADDNAAITISSARARLIPYQCQDGTWRLKFSIGIVAPSSVRSNCSVYINGVSSSLSGTQDVSGSTVNSILYTSYKIAYSSTNPVRIQVVHASGSTTDYIFSGDIELNAKPTWAY